MEQKIPKIGDWYSRCIAVYDLEQIINEEQLLDVLEDIEIFKEEDMGIIGVWSTLQEAINFLAHGFKEQTKIAKERFGLTPMIHA